MSDDDFSSLFFVLLSFSLVLNSIDIQTTIMDRDFMI